MLESCESKSFSSIFLSDVSSGQQLDQRTQTFLSTSRSSGRTLRCSRDNVLPQGHAWKNHTDVPTGHPDQMNLLSWLLWTRSTSSWRNETLSLFLKDSPYPAGKTHLPRIMFFMTIEEGMSSAPSSLQWTAQSPQSWGSCSDLFLFI